MSKTPNIRFNGFSDNWKEKQLSEIFVIKNNKNKNQYSSDGVLSVYDYEGCVNQIKFHGRSFAGKDISNYKIADIGDIIYTKSPLQSKPYGIVKIVTEEAGIVSPLYVVNVPTKENDSLFMYYLFDSPERTNEYLEPLVRKGAKNTMNISDAEWLSGNVVVSENLEEQQKIGLLFKKIDDLVNVETSKIDELSKIKQALLLKMFPVNNEDVPSIRFNGFTDTWEQRKFEILAEYKKGPFGSALKREIFVPKNETTVKVYEQQNAINKNWTLERYFITAQYAQQLNSFKVNGGDIIVSCAGTIGEIYELPINATPGIINQALMRIRINENVINKKMFIILFSNMIDEFSKTHSNGSAIKNIPPFSDLKPMEVLVPMTEEQNKISIFFTTLDQLITLHQCKLDKLKEVKAALLDKLLV